MNLMGETAVADPVDKVLDQTRLLPNDVDELSGSLAGHLRLNRTDLRALTILRRSSRVTAGELARSLRVTSGATTRVIDSLVRRGHVLRQTDERDRRRIVIRMTPESERLFNLALEGLEEDWRDALAGYQDRELAAVLRFLEDYRRSLRNHSRRLSRTASPST